MNPSSRVTPPEPIRNGLIACTFTNPMMIGPGLEAFTFDASVVTDDRIALYRRPLVVEGTTGAIGDWVVQGLFGDRSETLSGELASYASYEDPDATATALLRFLETLDDEPAPSTLAAPE